LKGFSWKKKREGEGSGLNIQHFPILTFSFTTNCSASFCQMLILLQNPLSLGSIEAYLCLRARLEVKGGAELRRMR
jgi:hypothetical protein